MHLEAQPCTSAEIGPGIRRCDMKPCSTYACLCTCSNMQLQLLRGVYCTVLVRMKWAVYREYLVSFGDSFLDCFLKTLRISLNNP